MQHLLLNYALTSGVVAITGASLSGWYTLSCEKQTANLKDSATINVQNGTVFYTETLVYIYNQLQASFRNELANYAQARVQIAVKDRNDKYWLLGYLRGLDLSAGESDSGTADGDRSGYTLTWMGMEIAPIASMSSANYALVRYNRIVFIVE
jgi:hypothetical protein